MVWSEAQQGKGKRRRKRARLDGQIPCGKSWSHSWCPSSPPELELHTKGRQSEATESACERQPRCTPLFEASERADLGFEGLVVLALDLKLGLQFLDEQFEAGDFHAKSLEVGCRGGGPRGD